MNACVNNKLANEKNEQTRERKKEGQSDNT